MILVTNLPEEDGRGYNLGHQNTRGAQVTQSTEQRPAQQQVSRGAGMVFHLEQGFPHKALGCPWGQLFFFLWLWLKIVSLETTNEEVNSLLQMTYH